MFELGLLFFLQTVTTYLSAERCFSCPSTCSSCNSFTWCTSCKSGYTLSSGSCSVPCLTNCLSCSSSGYCSSCKTGTYLSSGRCYSCSEGCSSCTSSSNCFVYSSSDDTGGSAVIGIVGAIACFGIACFDIACFGIACFDIACFDIACFGIACLGIAYCAHKCYCTSKSSHTPAATSEPPLTPVTPPPVPNNVEMTQITSPQELSVPPPNGVQMSFTPNTPAPKYFAVMVKETTTCLRFKHRGTDS